MLDTAPPKSLAANLALYLLSPLAVNGLIFSRHWDNSASATQNPMLPPGSVIGIIWLLLFTGMGTARYLARRTHPPAARWIDTLAILCLIYPLYTLGLSSDKIGLIGIILTATYTVVAIAALRRISTKAATLIAPVLLWLLYAGTALAVGLRHP